MEYRSVNSVLEVDDAVNYQKQFLTSLNSFGFPSHLPILKVGTPIMLLRNLFPPKICNGTRLRVIAHKKFSFYSLHNHSTIKLFIPNQKSTIFRYSVFCYNHK